MGIIAGGFFPGGVEVTRNPNGRIFTVPAEAGALQSAIDDSVDWNGDILVLQPGSHSVTSKVTVDKKGITIVGSHMGMNPSARGEQFTVNAAASLSSGPVMEIQQPCALVGIGIAGRDTTTESLLINAQETGGFNAGFCHIVNCRFSAWYGAMDAFIRSQGGQLTRIEDCTFDGLFGGVGTAAISMETDGLIDPGFMQLIRNSFYGMGSGKHAVVHKSGDTPVSVLYAHNYLMAGFGAQGKFLDNNSCDATGLIADNWLAPLANQAAAFENLTNATFGFADNHYEEA